MLPATVYRAVTELVADGLLARDPERGYLVQPVTTRSSEQAFDALRDGAERRGDDRGSRCPTSGSRVCGR